MSNTSAAAAAFTIRPATTRDVPAMITLIEPLVERKILLGKERVVFYEAVQEFRVAVTPEGELIGVGALHVLWEDLGEVRTLAASDAWRGHGIGRALLEYLEQDALALGLSRLFCLTFETEFFGRNGFTAIAEDIVTQDVYAQMIRSHDEGVAEFLDLARVKPNTLGNTRMIKEIAAAH